jgi:hypothetical protein
MTIFQALILEISDRVATITLDLPNRPWEFPWRQEPSFTSVLH